MSIFEIKELKEYRNALNVEIAFLKNGGGKKYKATNGNLIYSDAYTYVYSFDIEAELHIMDDAPVNIETLGGKQIDGSAIMCEDFQLLIAVREFIGHKLTTAWIKVEPWKLLDAQRNFRDVGFCKK